MHGSTLLLMIHLTNLSLEEPDLRNHSCYTCLITQSVVLLLILLEAPQLDLHITWQVHTTYAGCVWHLTF